MPDKRDAGELDSRDIVKHGWTGRGILDGLLCCIASAFGLVQVEFEQDEGAIIGVSPPSFVSVDTWECYLLVQEDIKKHY